MINNKEHFHEKKSLKTRLSELSVTSVVLIVILFSVCLVPIVWSWILAFQCNKDINQAWVEFLSLFFIFGVVFPVFSNIVYIIWSYKNCSKK